MPVGFLSPFLSGGLCRPADALLSDEDENSIAEALLMEEAPSAAQAHLRAAAHAIAEALTTPACCHGVLCLDLGQAVPFASHARVQLPGQEATLLVWSSGSRTPSPSSTQLPLPLHAHPAHEQPGACTFFLTTPSGCEEATAQQARELVHELQTALTHLHTVATEELLSMLVSSFNTGCPDEETCCRNTTSSNSSSSSNSHTCEGNSLWCSCCCICCGGHGGGGGSSGNGSSGSSLIPAEQLSLELSGAWCRRLYGLPSTSLSRSSSSTTENSMSSWTSWTSSTEQMSLTSTGLLGSFSLVSFHT